jgi:hypothetical protein
MKTKLFMSAVILALCGSAMSFGAVTDQNGSGGPGNSGEPGIANEGLTLQSYDFSEIHLPELPPDAPLSVIAARRATLALKSYEKYGRVGSPGGPIDEKAAPQSASEAVEMFRGAEIPSGSKLTAKTAQATLKILVKNKVITQAQAVEIQSGKLEMALVDLSGSGEAAFITTEHALGLAGLLLGGFYVAVEVRKANQEGRSMVGAGFCAATDVVTSGLTGLPYCSVAIELTNAPHTVSSAMEELGNDPSLQGSYLWNASHYAQDQQTARVRAATVQSCKSMGYSNCDYYYTHDNPNAGSAH